MFDFLKPKPIESNDARRAELLWKQGDKMLARKKYARAAESLREACELQPSRLEGRLNLGAALYMTGQFDEAIAHFKYVLAFEPQNTMALLNLAASYDGAGDMEKSIATLESLVSSRPQWKDAHYNLAVAYFKQKDYAKAQDAVRAELALSPDNELARALLNKIYLMPQKTVEGAPAAGGRQEAGDGRPESTPE